MQFPDLKELVPTVNGTTIVGIVTYLVWKDISSRRNGGPKSSELAALTENVEQLRHSFETLVSDLKKDSDDKWIMLHGVDKRLAVVENRCDSITRNHPQ